jgi:hypothetical protein
MRKIMLLVLGLSLIALSFMPVHAQDTPSAYFLAVGDGGTVALFRWASVEVEPEQITTSDSNIRDFAISPDGSMIVFSSNQQLWLQSGSDEVTALANLGQDSPAYPLFSLDGSQLAYSDVNGLWVMAVDGSSEPRLVLENTLMTDMDGAYDHFFMAKQFVPDSNSLIVQVLIWEGYTMGVLNLDTGEYQELPRDTHTNGLVTSSGVLLIYGNGGVGGEFNIQKATLDDLEGREMVVDLNALGTDVLYVEQAVEIQPGIVRVVGTGFNESGNFVFYFDLDVAALSASAVQTFPLPYDSTYLGELSPDGSRLALYNFNDQAAMLNTYPSGLLGIYDLTTGTLQDSFSAPVLAAPVADLIWQ